MDYDNLNAPLKAVGPVDLGKILLSIVPLNVVAKYSLVDVRLYGGWRSNGLLTTSAQRLLPTIHASSPSIISIAHAGATTRLRFTVQLAESPIWARERFTETFVKNRSLRKFRASQSPWQTCQTPSACGFDQILGVNHLSTCANATCTAKLGDILVRDEQKMVDTHVVADIAHHALATNAVDLVVVSSDTDIWPGVLLALHAGSALIHIHTQAGWRTQTHLMNTLPPRLAQKYLQLSV